MALSQVAVLDFSQIELSCSRVGGDKLNSHPKMAICITTVQLVRSAAFWD